MAEAYKTRDELKVAVLEELLVLGAGETASAEDLAAVETRIGPVLEDLATRGKCYVANTDEIEPAPFDYLVQIIAERCAPKFAGRPANRAVIADAEATLRILTRGQRGDGNSRLKFDRALRMGAR